MFNILNNFYFHEIKVFTNEIETLNQMDYNTSIYIFHG